MSIRPGGVAAPGAGSSQVATLPLVGIAVGDGYGYWAARVQFLHDVVDTATDWDAAIPYQVAPADTPLTFAALDATGTSTGSFTAGQYVLVVSAQDELAHEYPYPEGVVPLAHDAASAASSQAAMSTTHLAAVNLQHDPAVALAFGQQLLAIDFTGATVLAGEDWWGNPGAALPLAVTVPDGAITLPDDDCIYDVVVNLSLAGDAADEGSLVAVNVASNDGEAVAWGPLLSARALNFRAHCMTRVYPGDGATALAVTVDTSLLTADASLSGASVFILKR